jgi:hypothetical protein
MDADHILGWSFLLVDHPPYEWIIFGRTVGSLTPDRWV